MNRFLDETGGSQLSATESSYYLVLQRNEWESVFHLRHIMMGNPLRMGVLRHDGIE
jgi:hypothetical protein